MSVIFRILKWSFLTLLGLLVGGFAFAFVVIAPPPYPYFDWEPYFDQAYEEHGCEGAEWFASTAYFYGELNGPRAKYAELYLQDLCERGTFAFKGDAEAFLETRLGNEPDGSWDEHVRHHVSFVGINLISGAFLLLDDDPPRLNTPGRQEMAVDVILFALRCENPLNRFGAMYALRRRVAERLTADELLLPAWDRRWRECADRILNVARHWEETEEMPPNDRDGAIFLSQLAYTVREYAFRYQFDDLYEMYLRWELDGYASWRIGGDLIRLCPASWDEYGEAYESSMLAESRIALSRLLINAITHDRFFELAALGRLQELGLLLPRSDVWAYYWYMRSSQAGGDVDSVLARIAARLGPEEISRLDTIVDQGRMPDQPPDLVVQALRILAYYNLPQTDHSADQPRHAETIFGYLRPEDLAYVQSLRENGEEPQNLGLWSDDDLMHQGVMYQIDLVDCETGERPAWLDPPQP